MAKPKKPNGKGGKSSASAPKREPSPAKRGVGRTRAHMIAIRPRAPAKLHGMYMDPDGTRVAQAEAAALDAFPHLRVDRDGPRLHSLASLDVTIAGAWDWFRRHGWIAKATSSGRVRWNPGLDMLLKLEDRRLRLADSLLVSPRARREAKLPILPAEEAKDLNVLLSEPE